MIADKLTILQLKYQLNNKKIDIQHHCRYNFITARATLISTSGPLDDSHVFRSE